MIDDLNRISDGLSSSNDMIERMTYMMFGAVVTTTKAFDNVEIKLNADTQRVFISISVRWFARFKKFEPMRKYWLAKAERRVQKFVPKGWRVLIYYKKGEEHERND